MLDPSIARQLKSHGSHSSGFEGQSKFKWKLLSTDSFTSICNIGAELGFCGRENTSRVSFDTFYPYHEPFVPFGSNCAKTLAISKACEYVFNFQPNPFQLLCLKFKFVVTGATKCMCCLYFSFL